MFAFWVNLENVRVHLAGGLVPRFMALCGLFPQWVLLCMLCANAWKLMLVADRSRTDEARSEVDARATFRSALAEEGSEQFGQTGRTARAHGLPSKDYVTCGNSTFPRPPLSPPVA